MYHILLRCHSCARCSADISIPYHACDYYDDQNLLWHPSWHLSPVQDDSQTAEADDPEGMTNDHVKI
jgi:hypothetical protein